jgi:uncharacterized YccA/Bax inhibitor family protein
MPSSPLLTQQAFQNVGTSETRHHMTVAGTATATGVLLGLLLIAGAVGWNLVSPGQPVYNSFNEVIGYTTTIPPWLFLLGIGGFIAAIAGTFVPKLSPLLGPVYALCYGVLIGAISHLYEIQFQGIVIQAIGATIGVFGVMFFLYASRIIKVTRKYVLIVVGAMFGLLAFYLVAFVASLFGANIYFMDNPSWLGIAVSIGIAVLAAANLAIDFAFIEQMSETGTAPKYMEWYGALGLTVGLVWLYLQLLRVLALLRN